VNQHGKRTISSGVLPRVHARAETQGVRDRYPRDLTLFAERQELFIERFYKDEAKSGVAADRKALRRLLRNCQAGRVGTVIIPTRDRLSRDLRLAENLFHEFEQLGVKILIADMPTYNGNDLRGVLIRQIRGAIAEENRKEIIERLWKGRQRVRRGLPPGGNVPYGYRRTARGVVVVEMEAEVVRMIFAMAERHEGKSAILATTEERDASDLLRSNGPGLRSCA
jgi:site-specific DNA recombinase